MVATVKNIYRLIKDILNVFFVEEYLLFGLSLILCGLFFYTNRSPQVAMTPPLIVADLIVLRRGVFFFMDNFTYCILLPFQPIKLVFNILCWIGKKFVGLFLNPDSKKLVVDKS